MTPLVAAQPCHVVSVATLPCPRGTQTWSGLVPSVGKGLEITGWMHIALGTSLLLDLSVVRVRNFVFKKREIMNFQFKFNIIGF